MVRKFFENNMIHFLGSDVHKKNTIYPRITQALNEIKDIIGKEKLNELTTINPNMVLEDRKIDIDEPIEFKMSLKEKMIINLK